MPFWTVQLLEMMKQWLSIYCWEYWLKVAQNPTTTSFSCWWWDVEGFIIHRSIAMLSHHYPITNPWIVTGIVYDCVNPTLTLLSLDLLRPPFAALATIHHGTRISVTFSGTPYDSIQTAGCLKNAGVDGDLFGEHWPAGHAVGIPNMNPDPVEFVDNKHLYGICIYILPRK
jgi:hypothetical protein